MQTTREQSWSGPAGTLIAGALGATAIWLVGGAPEMTPVGFVLAAVTRETGRSRGCLRRLGR